MGNFLRKEKTKVPCAPGWHRHEVGSFNYCHPTDQDHPSINPIGGDDRWSRKIEQFDFRVSRNAVPLPYIVGFIQVVLNLYDQRIRRRRRPESGGQLRSQNDRNGRSKRHDRHWGGISSGRW